MYYNTLDVLKTKVFLAQLVFAIMINFGANFGFQWATLSDYGNWNTLQPMKFWTKNDAGASIVFDVYLTVFLLAFITILLATWGIKVSLHPVRGWRLRAHPAARTATPPLCC